METRPTVRFERQAGPALLAIRPTHHKNEISFLWTPGEKLVELAHIPGAGMRFTIKDRDGIKYADGHEKFKSLARVEEFAKDETIKLAVRPEPSRSVDALAATIKDFIYLL